MSVLTDVERVLHHLRRARTRSLQKRYPQSMARE
jgi:hypothetical protein